jgi:hypothetical protein
MNAETQRAREDILVSLCLTDFFPTPETLSESSAFVDHLARRFRFFEIVIVAPDSEKDSYLPLIQELKNLRLLLVRNGLSPYDERVVAAAEAIGDVVLLTGPERLNALDLLAMIEMAVDTGQIIVEKRRNASGGNRIILPILGLVGRMAGYRAGTQEGPSVALPRTLLNQLLEHSDPDLALRFLPRDPALPVATMASQPGKVPRRGTGSLIHRISLLGKLIVHMAPTVLVGVSIASALLACFGVIFAVYALGVWLIKPDVTPGWLTLSGMLSVTATFIGITAFGLSVGLQRVLMLSQRHTPEKLASEVGKIDIFSQVSAELNVELDRTQDGS